MLIRIRWTLSAETPNASSSDFSSGTLGTQTPASQRERVDAEMEAAAAASRKLNLRDRLTP
jgi:hypothetical protein